MSAPSNEARLVLEQRESSMTQPATSGRHLALVVGLCSAMSIIGGVGIGMTVSGANAATPAVPTAEAVKASLVTRLPMTKVTSVDCGRHGALCEITAGSNLFYTEASGRFLVIGRVYDMETRQDLTAARLLELNPDLLVAGSARAGEGEEGREQVAERPAASTVPLSELPRDGAINWGSRRGPKVVVFSDLRCSYCNRLHEALAGMNVRVEERPISVLGSRDLSDAVYCAKDPAKALKAAYAGKVPQGSPRCDTTGLDANEAFARRHGFMGTPVLVREDGSVLEGYRPASQLSAWLKAAQAPVPQRAELAPGKGARG